MFGLENSFVKLCQMRSERAQRVQRVQRIRPALRVDCECFPVLPEAVPVQRAGRCAHCARANESSPRTKFRSQLQSRQSYVSCGTNGAPQSVRCPCVITVPAASDGRFRQAAMASEPMPSGTMQMTGAVAARHAVSNGSSAAFSYEKS